MRTIRVLRPVLATLAVSLVAAGGTTIAVTASGSASAGTVATASDAALTATLDQLLASSRLAGSTDTVTATRAHGTNTVTVTGSSPLTASAAGIDLVSVLDPTQLAAGVFRDALKRHGVTVTGSTTVGSTPSSVKTITDHASIPLSQLLPPFLKLSNNGHAELLTKAMGRAKSPSSAGSWSTGLAAGRTALQSLGVNTSVISMGHGSGLSRRDWLTTPARWPPCSPPRRAAPGSPAGTRPCRSPATPTRWSAAP
jgi:D-alanyl-D-alanine carboxypeptidase/D-alanyl-D-alanine-endopeptidase (penicillin-binding protein 4)